MQGYTQNENLSFRRQKAGRLVVDTKLSCYIPAVAKVRSSWNVHSNVHEFRYISREGEDPLEDPSVTCYYIHL